MEDCQQNSTMHLGIGRWPCRVPFAAVYSACQRILTGRECWGDSFERRPNASMKSSHGF